MTARAPFPPAGPKHPTLSSYPPRVESFSTKPHHDPRTDVDVLAEIAMDLARGYGKVTADDLRRLTPNAQNKTANYGAVFQKLVKEGKLVFVCYQRSQTPLNHGRRISVYAIPKSPGHRVCP